MTAFQKSKLNIWFCGSVGFLALAAWVVWQGAMVNASAQSAPAPKVAMSDEEFARKASNAGMAEIRLGQLAQQKGESLEVRNFGKTMVDDHTKAGNELKEVIFNENMTVAPEVSQEDLAIFSALTKLSGAEFDAAYARQMVKEHETAVALFQAETNDGKKLGLKSFANQKLPTLQGHLKDAKDMVQKVARPATT